jgi:hypothetical protein
MSSLDSKNSLLAGFMHQSKYYKQMNVKNNCLSSPLINELLNGTKNKFNAFKFLTINSNHFNLSKELPNGYILLIMQFSPDK